MDPATTVLDRFGHSPENTYTALSELSGVPGSTLCIPTVETGAFPRLVNCDLLVGRAMTLLY
jgi:hypothetical protein